MDSMKTACHRIRDTYSIRWGNGSPDGDGPGQNVPDEFFFRPKKEVSILHEGADEQMEWATEFVEHRCMWLRDKYGIEIGVNFAEQKLMTGKCPISECEEQWTQEARHSND